VKENRSRLTRRSFMAAAASALATAGLAGVSPRSALAQAEAKSDKKLNGRIIQRKLGRTGLELPVVSMGVMNASIPEIIQASYELGMRHFDTAAWYQFGRNEQMVGNVIKNLGVRDKVVIGTKIHTPDQRRGLTPEQHKDKIIESTEASLRRLKTDYVDILYIHDMREVSEISDEGLIEGMKEVKRQGKARWIGVSTHTQMADQIAEANRVGGWDVILTAINFTMADDTALLKAIAEAAAKGTGIVAMKTLAGGSRWPNPESRQRYESATIISAALKWVLRNENIHTCIPGFTNFDHMRQDFAVVHDLEYTSQEESFLKDNSITLGMGFCRQCRGCLASCPRGVEIPTLMRTHMYAAQYSDFHQARATLDSLPHKTGLAACSDCKSCTAECINSVDIRRKIEELKLIYA